MDLRMPAPKGYWSAFSRFQNNSDGGAEEELQRLAPLGGISPRDITRQALGSPRGTSGSTPLGLAGCEFGGGAGQPVTPMGAREEAGLDGSASLNDTGGFDSTSSSAGGAAPLSPWIILPDGQFKTGWMYIQLAVAMYIVWVTPVRVGFDIPAEGLWFWFEGMIDLFFYVDLVLNFFTAYEDRVTGDLVTDHRAVALRYLTGWFAVDLLATFPVDYIVRAVEGSWLCSLRGDCSWAILNDSAISPIALLRLLRFFRIMWILKHARMMRFATLLGGLADDLYAMLPVFSILELVIILIYLGHISGCFFYLLSTPPWQTHGERALIASGEITTWMQRAFGGHKIVMLPSALNASGLARPGATGAAVNGTNGTLGALLARPLPPTATQDAKGRWWVCADFGYDMAACPGCEGPPMRCVSHYGLAIRYVTSMYWAYTTMTTVGYGDISSTTLAEKLWAIVTMIVSGFFFSFVVGRMAALVAKLDSHRTAYNERLEVVTTFLRDTNLPRPLSKRVLDMFRKQKVKPYDRQAVLGVLPFELKAKILRHLYAGAIRDVPLLRTMAGDDLFMTDMCIRLQPYSCPASTFVYQRGEPGGDVFILLRGELLQLDVDHATQLAKISEGSVFGEGSVLRAREGFSRVKRTENMWCQGPCYMLRIAQEDMADLMEQYPALADTLAALNSDRARGRGGGRRMRPSAGHAAASTAGRQSSHSAADGVPVLARSGAGAASAGGPSPLVGSGSRTDLSRLAAGDSEAGPGPARAAGPVAGGGGSSAGSGSNQALREGAGSPQQLTRQQQQVLKTEPLLRAPTQRPSDS